ncbi:MAG: hypothetical protein MI865_01435, partial [Proteobacteria bacterium]|nr:hypothetical protein [Pseudomonadota bacterium]
MFYSLSGAETNLQGYYRFDQGVADADNTGIIQLPDRSFNNNNGILTSFTLNGTSSNWVGSGAFIPADPADLFTNEISATQIDLSWTDQSLNETGFAIERSVGNNSGFTFLDNVGTDVTTYSDVSVSGGNGYYYRVIANGSSGDSNPSNEKFGSAIQVPGNALLFDGVDDVVDLGDPDEVDFGSGDFTLELWLKLDSLANGNRNIISKQVAGQRQFQIQFDRDFNGNVKDLTLIVWRPDDSSFLLDSDPNAITDTEWHHLALLRNGTIFEIYVDGTLIKSGLNGGPTGDPMGATTADLLIGGGTTAGFVDGEIDEVRIWGDARTQPEIQSNMFNSLVG